MLQPDKPLGMLLAGALLLAGWLLWPFADALILATVVAVLAWPLHRALRRRLGRHDAVAAALSVLVLVLGVIGPLGGLLWLLTRELLGLAEQLATELEQGRLEVLLARAQALPAVAWLVEQAGGAATVDAAIREQSRALLGSVATGLGQSVAGLVGQTARAVLKVTVFLLTLGALLLHGERLLHLAERLSPLPDTHTERLFQVFARFARNVVLAGLVAATVQGLVAGVGYVIVGLERAGLWALLTGVLAYVPLVGTAAAWVPITLLLLLQGRPGAALFVAAWSTVLTGTVDNLVKPLVVRGRSDVPAVLVFLGVFGGLSTMGLVGVLVGPIVMALLLALVRLVEEGAGPRSAG